MATPVVLHATNNVVVHLAPAAVVAKVSRSVPSAARELDVAQHCAALGAPVVSPAEGIEPRVYDDDAERQHAEHHLARAIVAARALAGGAP